MIWQQVFMANLQLTHFMLLPNLVRGTSIENLVAILIKAEVSQWLLTAHLL